MHDSLACALVVPSPDVLDDTASMLLPFSVLPDDMFTNLAPLLSLFLLVLFSLIDFA